MYVLIFELKCMQLRELEIDNQVKDFMYRNTKVNMYVIHTKVHKMHIIKRIYVLIIQTENGLLSGTLIKATRNRFSHKK